MLFVPLHLVVSFEPCPSWSFTESCPGSRAVWVSSTRTRVNGNSALDLELFMAQPIPVPAVLVLMAALGNKEQSTTKKERKIQDSFS